MAEIIDILNIQPNKVNASLSGKTLLIYGKNKVGKTTWCTKELPKPLLCAFEKGYNAIPGVKAIDVTKWTQFKQIVKQLDNPAAKEMYESVIIDTVDIMASLCESYVCQQAGVSALSEVPFGKLYGEYTKEMTNILRKITMMGYGLAFIAQEDIKIVKDDKGEEIEKLQPMLDKRALKVVNAIVDFILYIGQEWDENGNNNRYFYTRNTPFITAGSRFGEMAPKIPFSYKALIDEVQKAMEKNTADNPNLLIDEKVEYTPEVKRPFRETMQEAGELWAQFPKSQEWNEKKMTIVQEYFGQPIKLSTATETQQDLVESVIQDLKNLLSTIK